MMNDLNVELWSRLTFRIIGQILSFLPVPVLCRFCTVCKKWNLLICKPEFGVLWTANGEQDARFIVVRWATKCGSRFGDIRTWFGKDHGWSILDLNARRWYTIKDDKQEVFDYFNYANVTMHGGLVCQNLHLAKEGIFTYVSNPIAKTSRRLPSSPYNFSICMTAEVNMLANNLAHDYKIFVTPSFGDWKPIGELHPLMAIYESTSNQWQSSTNVPMPLLEVRFYVIHSTFFDGMLYVLLSPFDERDLDGSNPVEYWIWSYNHIEDTWKYTGVNIHMQLYRPRLVVSNKRLFLVCCEQKYSDTYSPLNHSSQAGFIYEISEVRVADKICTRVFQMTEELAMLVFDVPRSLHYGPRLHAFGFAKSIVLLCESSGISIVYDLSTCLWDLLPANPLMPPPEDSYFWYGKPMNLILPEWENKTETGV